jgi:hypothetical protein
MTSWEVAAYVLYAWANGLFCGLVLMGRQP